MKTIQLKDKTVNLITSLEDIDASKFIKCLGLFKSTDFEDDLDRYTEIISLLSDLPKNEIEQLDLDVYETLIKMIDINNFETFQGEFTDELVVDGVTYKTRNKEYKFNVSEIRILKNSIKENKESYVLDLASAIFYESDVHGELILDYSPESLSSKKEKLKDIKMNILAPYLLILSSYFTNKNA